MKLHPDYEPHAKVMPERSALFLPYQKRWIEDDSKIKAMEKSRQIGLSWGTAYRCVAQASLEGARYDFWISSRDDIQARLFLEDCKAFAKILQAAAIDLGERVYLDDKGNPFTAYTLELANGRKIYSMSSNPDAQAGKRGTRVLDEFALHPDPRKLYSIALPGITWGGQMEIISTHRGSHNFFNTEIIQSAKGENKKGISLHTVSLQNALDQGFLYKLQKKLSEGSLDDARLYMDEAAYFDQIRSECADEESFLQEYMCQPADDATAFLSYDMIAACEHPEYPKHAEHTEDVTGLDGKGRIKFMGNLDDLHNSRNRFSVGVDIGRDHDLTCIHCFEETSDLLLERYRVEMYNIQFDRQRHELWKALKHRNLRRVCIDNTGLGKQLGEETVLEFKEHKAERVTFTAPVKEELAYPLKSRFEDRSIRIFRDKYTRADLRGIKKETTAAGNERFAADRGKNGHSDRFWGMALAVHAAKNPIAPGKPSVFDSTSNRFNRSRDRRVRSVA